MMGTKARVFLEELVPPDHFSRRLKRTLAHFSGDGLAVSIIAAVSFSGQAESSNTPSLAAWTELLRELAEQISSQLGWADSGKAAH